MRAREVATCSALRSGASAGEMPRSFSNIVNEGVSQYLNSARAELTDSQVLKGSPSLYLCPGLQDLAPHSCPWPEPFLLTQLITHMSLCKTPVGRKWDHRVPGDRLGRAGIHSSVRGQIQWDNLLCDSFLCAITTKIHQTELRGFNAGNCGAKCSVIGLTNESGENTTDNEAAFAHEHCKKEGSQMPPRNQLGPLSCPRPHRTSPVGASDASLPDALGHSNGCL